MAFLTDIEIAQSCTMQPITDIAKVAGVDEEYLELYGKYKAKVDYKLLKEVQQPDGKLILVTATPSALPITCWPPCWITTFSRATAWVST